MPQVGGPPGSAPQRTVGEHLGPTAGAVDDQQHEQGEEKHEDGGALALQVGDSIRAPPQRDGDGNHRDDPAQLHFPLLVTGSWDRDGEGMGMGMEMGIFLSFPAQPHTAPALPVAALLAWP